MKKFCGEKAERRRRRYFFDQKSFRLKKFWSFFFCLLSRFLFFTDGDAISLIITDSYYSMSQHKVIVIGGGLAGLSAAHTILENGGSVVLLDKSAFLGGNSTKATSGINGACQFIHVIVFVLPPISLSS
tara:strand:+ start:648 stop:1034 length:387 start_codon:yes stop_codon:yes gene_type:complete